MPGKLMLMVNPKSGRGVSKSALGGIITQMCDAGYGVTVFTPGEERIEKLVGDHAGNFDLLVCAGGDGTFSATVSGLLDAGLTTPVGFIPTGTTNDVATTLSLPRNPLVAASTILTGTPHPLDVGMFGEEYFTYVAAFGAFTDVSYNTPQGAKRALGHLAYVLGGLASMSAIEERHVVVEYDEGIIDGEFIFGGVTNSLSIAGLARLDPGYVNLSDGKFEVILVKRPMNLAEFGDIVSRVMRQDYSGDNVQLFHSSKINFTFDGDVMWTRDGEDGGLHRKLELVNLHEAVTVVF